MDTALQWAGKLTPAAQLPSSLADAQRRVDLVEKFEKEIMPGIVEIGNRIPGKDQFHNLSSEEKSQLLKKVAVLSKEFIIDVPSDDERAGLTLALWSGCVAAGKTIAMGTRAGPNTEEIRTRIFSTMIDPVAKQNPIFRAGVEVAPLWKAGRKEPVSFAGVPLDSTVRKHHSG